ncbi:MAG: mannonate dehydratase, partial [Ruthenibacterium sp.]
GLGLYRHMLTPAYFQFAKQCGCTHLILHLANYYSDNKGVVTATDEKHNYGVANALDPIWELDSLLRLKQEAATYGLTIYGIENFSPADWYDVLLDGPKKQAQMENLKKIIRNVGKAGIHAFGYNFSLAGVWGHQKKTAARGGAISTCFDASLLNIDAPIPNGEVWNMTYAAPNGEQMPPVSSDELWQRLAFFLREILPVAEEAGVEMALHPDDPPMPTLRGTPRMVYRPELYQKALDLMPSSANKLEFCLGSLQEMEGMDIYDAIDLYAAQHKISYLHFRNVKGKVPCYDEVFVDEGDIDMLRVLQQLQAHHFDGVLIPDHTPLMTCDAPWHAGMAFALGYMRAAFQMLDKGFLE